MALVVNTNLFSLNAQRNLSKSQSPLATAMQRLSSTLRINSAKDDAAGLSIATRMMSQSRGLAQAVRNANDGVSFAQTAEGSLDEVINALQRVRELAVQSASGNYSDAQRSDMNKEVQAMMAEIDRISTATELSGTKILDGTFGTKTLQVGSNANQTVDLTIGGVSRSGLGLAGVYTMQGGEVSNVALAEGDLQFKVNGQSYSVGDATDGVTTLGQVSSSAWAGAIAINKLTTVTGITATANDTVAIGGVIKDREVADATKTLATGAAAAALASTATNVSFSLTGSRGTATIDVSYSAGDSATQVFNSLRDAVNAVSSETGISASEDTGTASMIILKEEHGTDILVQGVSAQEEAVIGLGNMVETGLAVDIAVDFDLNGENITYTLASTQWSAFDRTSALMNAINDVTEDTGVTASVNSAGDQIILTGAGGIEIFITTTTVIEADDVVVDAGNVSDITGLTSIEGQNEGTITLTSKDKFSVIAGAVAGSFTYAGFAAEEATLATSSDISTVAGANSTITAVDDALIQVASQRADLGAILNRLDSTVRNLENINENVTASRSRIMDADFAAETANLTKAMIMQQAGISILSQANTLPQQVLSLLSGR